MLNNNLYLIVFDIKKEVFERAIDPRFFIEDLRELGKLDVNIVIESIPKVEESVTDEHKFKAFVTLSGECSIEDVEDSLEFILNEGVLIETISNNTLEKLNNILLESLHNATLDEIKIKIEPFLKKSDSTPTKEKDDTQKVEENIPQNLLNSYFIESKEVISKLDREISNLKDNLDDKELINELFRNFHTLKGGTGVILSYRNILYLEKLKDLAHHSEGLLHKVRDSDAVLNKNDVDNLQIALDRIDDLLNATESSKELDINEIDIAINSLNINKLQNAPKEHKDSDIDVHHQALKEVLNQYFPIYESLMPKTQLEENEIEFLSNSINTLSKMSAILMIKEFDSVAKELNLSIQNNTNIKGSLSKLHKVLDDFRNREKIQKNQDGDTNKYIAKSSTLRINEQVINQLMDVVGEISVFKEWINFFIAKLNKSYQSQEASKELKEQYQRFKNLVNNMQGIVLDMRMVPLSTLFERFPKLVRDLSRVLNKEIDFKEEGGDTRLDKVIIEKIGEPMVHLIRNSIDHGIESPQKRLELGKPKIGSLSIKAYQYSGSVYINIVDDGGGIDVEKIKSTAIKRGVITPESAETLSEQELKELIFLPGFSTKDIATEISGRGVGTDAILSAVREIGGDIRLESELNKGTSITLEVPLTLAMQKILLCKIGGSIYGIPADFVSEIVKIDKKEISFYNNLHLFLHRQNAIKIEYANEILDLNSSIDTEEITLLIDNSKKRAIAVDSLLNTIDTVVKPVPDVINNIDEITGVTILGDGTIVYIVTF